MGSVCPGCVVHAGPACVDVYLWAIGKKFVTNVTCRVYVVWLPCACITDVSREPWICCCTVVMHLHIRPGSFWMLLLSLCSQLTDDPRYAAPKEEEGSFGILLPMGFFSPSVSCSQLLLLHPAQSLPKSPRQCSMLLLYVILLCSESFEEVWIDDFLILKR